MKISKFTKILSFSGSFLLALSALLMSGCGGKATTEAQMVITVGKIAADQLTPFTAGGGILYGLNNDTQESFALNLVDAPGPISVVLENGSWTFYGLLWDGNGGSNGGKGMEGKVRCADLTADLAGGEISLNLTFDNAKCINRKFSTNAVMDTNFGYVKFPQLSILSCQSIGGIVDETGMCGDGVPGTAGYVKSYRIVLETYDDTKSLPGVGGPIMSDCMNVTSSSYTEANHPDGSYFNVPTGSGEFPLKTNIISYPMSDCNGIAGEFNSFFDKGIHTPNGVTVNNFKSFNFNEGGIAYRRYFHQVSGDQYCNANMAPPGSMSGGDGSFQNPYVICTPEQFELIGRNGHAMTSSYKLARDLDFKGREKEISPNGIICDELGFASNLIPVGFDCGGSPNIPFIGTFDGNHKTMSNILIFADEKIRIGIFTEVGNGATTGTIRNLTIKNSEIEAGTVIGTVAGVSDQSTFENINIEKTSLRSSSESSPAHLGGVVGLAHGGSYNNLISRAVKLEGDTGPIGGIIGMSSGTSSATIFQSFFSGHIRGYSDASSALANGYGGLVGRTAGANSLAIDFSISKGLISINGKKAGGLVGDDPNGRLVMYDSYSQMVIGSYSGDTGLFLGGLVGNAAGSSLNGGYFSGDIYSYCQSSCNIGGISGTSSISQSSVYSPEAFALGGHDGLVVVDTSNNETNALRNITQFNSGYLNSNWSFQNGRYPRLNWELTDLPQKCNRAENLISVADQKTNGRGTPTNPIALCVPEQIAEIKDAGNTSLFYELHDAINLNKVFEGNTVNMIPNFTGAIRGNGRFLYGGNIMSTSSGSPVGLFSTLGNSLIEDLSIIGLNVVQTGVSNPANPMGVLAGIGNGIIRDFKTTFSSVNSMDFSASSTGGVVGQNGGTIERVHSGANVYALSNFGGIAGENFGNIRHAISNLYVSGYPYGDSANVQNVGGIAGKNYQDIESSFFEGNLNFSNVVDTSYFVTNVGGIAGYNNTGSIKDSYTSDYAKIYVHNGTNIGGMVGRNNGDVERSYNAAEVLVGYCNDGMNFVKADCTGGGGTWALPTNNDTYGAIVGLDESGGAIHTNVFYMNKANEILKSYTSGFTTSVEATNSYCRISFSGAQANSGFDVNNEIFIGNHNKVFPIKDVLTANQVFDVDMGIAAHGDESMCTDFSSSESYWDNPSFMVVKPYDTGVGERRFHLTLTKPETYCSGIGSGDENFKCSSADGWDIAEDTPDRDEDPGTIDPGAGFSRLVDFYIARIFGENPPSNPPIWRIEPGQDELPEHIFRD